MICRTFIQSPRMGEKSHHHHYQTEMYERQTVIDTERHLCDDLFESSAWQHCLRARSLSGGWKVERFKAKDCVVLKACSKDCIVLKVCSKDSILLKGLLERLIVLEA